MPITKERQNFIDWMKAIGMFLIVAGHVIGDPYSTFNQIAQPAYTKQLGVAFFVFIAGWGLANVRQPSFYTVYSRLFTLCAFGLLFAIFFTILGFLIGPTLKLSNYLPLALGVNVFFNNFPANATTWYIGTYIHLLLLWFFLLRHHSVGIPSVIVCFVLENAVRIALLVADKSFIAYMFFPNWLTVFMLGRYLYKQKDSYSRSKALIYAGLWLLFAVAWSYSMRWIPIGEAFPIRNVMLEQTWAIPLQSFLLSTIYLLSTWLLFQFARSLPANRLVQFLARNTIVIFIIHLPIIFAFHPTWYAWISNVPFVSGQVSLIFVVYLGCAVISEVLRKLLRIEEWKKPVWDFVSPVLLKLGLVK